MKYPILSKINSPDDLKKLPEAQLEELCSEVREKIIETVAKNGGHLASNLGAVELTVALHLAFSSPKDAIVFDVGHQCYTHKLLTGRFNEFSTLRTKDGISGFMRPNESVHDPVISGHSSCSISAAYGIYKAKKLKGEAGTAVAVIGDGAMTGGMAYEALNNAGHKPGNFVVVLNDNKMSISKNVGSLSRAFTKMRNKPKYHHFKSSLAKFLLKSKPGRHVYNFLDTTKEQIKRLVYKEDIFTALGFKYLGPVDGHDISALTSLFKVAKNSSRPTLVHVITTKGKGYAYAENNPKNYHGVSPFDIDKGAASGGKTDFSNTAGQTLCALAEKDSSICAISAAMTEGTGLFDFSKKYRQRFFDVGIAESHAVTFAAGLAKGGMKPYFVVYSSFLQRGYDQLLHDVATAKLPVRFLIDRAGIVGEDGETHQGLFDISYLTDIPEMIIYSPSNYEELEYRIIYSAKTEQMMAIRYPRGCEKSCIEFDKEADYHLLKGEGDTLIVTYGRLYSEACLVKEELDDINVLKLNKIYPLEQEVIDIISGYKNVFVFEETQSRGSIGELISAKLLESGFKGKCVLKAVDNEFLPQSTVSDALKDCELDAKGMLNAVKGL